MRSIVDLRLKQLQEDNAKQIDKMRSTVDEKLQGTLEKRLGESFLEIDVSDNESVTASAREFTKIADHLALKFGTERLTASRHSWREGGARLRGGTGRSIPFFIVRLARA